MSSDGLRDCIVKAMEDYQVGAAHEWFAVEPYAIAVVEAVRGYLATKEVERVEAMVDPLLDATLILGNWRFVERRYALKALPKVLRAADRVVGLLRDDEETQR